MSSSRSTLSSPGSMGQVLKAAPRVVPRLPAYLGVGLVFLYRYTLGVLARKPVENQEARRHGPSLTVDGVEVPGAGEAIAALH